MGKHHGWPIDKNVEDMDVSSSSQGVRYCEAKTRINDKQVKNDKQLKIRNKLN